MLEFFNSILQFISDIRSYVGEFWDLLVWIIFTFLPGLVTGGFDQITALLSLFSSLLNLDFNSIGFSSDYGLATINVFFPLTEFMRMVSAYLSFISGMAVVRWLLKLTPFF